jgi:hypothetical protein
LPTQKQEKNMLNFQDVRDKKTTIQELAKSLTQGDLVKLTNEMIDAMQALIKGCVDADVTFVPVDPAAKDDAASNAADANIAWTLGHVIVHATASSEEAAFLAAEMARGVEFHGRSRYETPWESITSIAQCHARLEESRRMRVALAHAWPDKPNTTIEREPWPGAGMRNCYAQFIGGLSHDDSHLGQIAEIVRQAKAGR